MQYTLNTIARKLSDWKVIIGFATVVLGTLVNVALNLINNRVLSLTSPLVGDVKAVQSKQVVLEQALLDAKDTDKRIESKLDRITLKLIPNANINYSQ